MIKASFVNQITNSVIILIVIIYFFTKSNKAISLSPNTQRLITAKIKAREASARFLTQYGVEPGGG